MGKHLNLVKLSPIISTLYAINQESLLLIFMPNSAITVSQMHILIFMPNSAITVSQTQIPPQNTLSKGSGWGREILLRPFE